MSVPEHECPSPVYPALQMHLLEPYVLVQFAFTSQSLMLYLHSSISKIKNVQPPLRGFSIKAVAKIKRGEMGIRARNDTNQQIVIKIKITSI